MSPLPFSRLFLGLANALLLGAAAAQSPSSTPVIGFYKQSFAQGGVYSLVNGFVTKTDFQGQATATPVVGGVSMTITQTGAGWTNDQFNTFPVGDSSHYLEVLDDGNATHTGLILDITDNTASTIIAEVPSGFVPGTNFKYAVRKHTTLETALGSSCGLLEDSDAALMFDSVGNEIVALFSTGGVWQNANDLSSLANKVLYPGQGLILFLADQRTITMGGGVVSYVKSGPTRISLPEAVPTLVGLINPLVSSSLSDQNTMNNAGFNLITPDADFLIRFKEDGTLETEREAIYSSAYNSNAGGLVSASNLLLPVGGEYLRNGSALLYIPASDVSFILPQRH